MSLAHIRRGELIGRTDAKSLPEKLPFITGLRGVAALVVAVGHMWGMVGPDHPGGPLWDADAEHVLLWFWQFGKPMVWVFILVSGFALFWSEEGRLLAGRKATSLRSYAVKRAWRILPTYYVSLALGLLIVAGAGWWLAAPSPSLRTYIPLTPGGLVSHVFLVHNLAPGWIYQVNPPLWSIAVEVQLYVLFPFLLWVGRRWNTYAGASALVVGVFLLNAVTDVPLFALAHWFIIGAVLAHFARRWTLHRGALYAVAGSTLAIGFLRIPGLQGRIEELVWMAGFSCLVLALVQTGTGRRNPLAWSSTQWLGERSYSLYAVHFPLALIVWGVVSRLGLDRPGEVVTIILAGVGLSLVLSNWCYRLVELPSMQAGQRMAASKVTHS